VLGAFRSALATPDLRRKILFALSMVVIYRAGATLPSPGVSYVNINQCLDRVQHGDNQNVYSLINLFSGGALLRLSVFALGIMPYITASIIIQLLTVVIPRFEVLKKEGQSGQNKLTQYTRYLTIALAILQSTGIVALAVRGQLFSGCPLPPIPDQSVFNLVVIVVVMTAGTGVIMWLGELITERGIGNGMSLLIFTSIAARIPAEGKNILDSQGLLVFLLVCLFGLAIIASVVFVEQGQRRIPVQYAKRMIGRRMYGGTSTYLPLKVNQAGVIPVIFASSLLYVPQLLTNVWHNASFSTFVTRHLNSQASDDRVYLICYALLILGFTYFYVAITFNTDEIADNMKKYGGFVPGIRPGRPTAEYLGYILDRITLPGALYLAAIAVIPYIFIGLVNATKQFPFGGTAVLILVGVGLDTAKQIESQLMLRNYEGFLR
jgi:preprotein translocase subunit SecY